MKIPKTKKISKCRLCFNKNLIKIHSFGNLFVSNFVSKKNIKKGIKAPLVLVYCKKCKLLQLEHSAPQEIMYRKFYWYRSGITDTMKDALKDIFTTAKNMSILNTFCRQNVHYLNVFCPDSLTFVYMCNISDNSTTVVDVDAI